MMVLNETKDHIRWQFAPCHNSSIVMKQDLWPNKIIEIIVIAKIIFIRFQLWAQSEIGWVVNNLSPW